MSSGGPRDATAFEVRDALREHGCAICRLTARSVHNAIRSIAYEQINDIALRADLRQSSGFCNRHAHQWLKEAHSVLGTALIYRDVLQSALRELASGAPARGRLRGLKRLGAGEPARDGCVLCRTQREAEARYLEALAAVVGGGGGGGGVDSESIANGLCRRHVLALVRSGGGGLEAVVARTRAEVETMIRELDEVIRKEDYRFRHETRSEGERTVPARAIAWAAGAEGLVDR
jgi:uncharacterized protein DUF6062